jgi:hypothetical protein
VHDDVFVSGEIGRKNLLRAPVRQPESTVVPSRRFTHRKAGDENLHVLLAPFLRLDDAPDDLTKTARGRPHPLRDGADQQSAIWTLHVRFGFVLNELAVVQGGTRGVGRGCDRELRATAGDANDECRAGRLARLGERLWNLEARMRVAWCFLQRCWRRQPLGDSEANNERPRLREAADWRVHRSVTASCAWPYRQHFLRSTAVWMPPFTFA